MGSGHQRISEELLELVSKAKRFLIGFQGTGDVA